MSDVIRLNSPVNFRNKNYNVVKVIDSTTLIIKPTAKNEPAVVIHSGFLDELKKGHIKEDV